jgi:hypothetical protein
MKAVVKRVGGLILGLVLLSGAAVSSSAHPYWWHRHYRVYYTRPVYHSYVYHYPRRNVYYYPRGYYVTWHRYHHYRWWHHHDWD